MSLIRTLLPLALMTAWTTIACSNEDAGAAEAGSLACSERDPASCDPSDCVLKQLVRIDQNDAGAWCRTREERPAECAEYSGYGGDDLACFCEAEDPDAVWQIEDYDGDAPDGFVGCSAATAACVALAQAALPRCGA